MTVWFKGTEMGTSYCSPYLKLNIFWSNPGSRIHPSRPWLLFSKQYLFNSLFLLKPLFNEVGWSLRCIQLVGRPKRTFRFLKCVQVINKNASTCFKASLGQIIKTIPMQGDISYTILPAFQVGSKNINTKSTKRTYFLFSLLETFSWARRFT